MNRDLIISLSLIHYFIICCTRVYNTLPYIQCSERYHVKKMFVICLVLNSYGNLTLVLNHVKGKTKPASAGCSGQMGIAAPPTLAHFLCSSNCSTSLDSSTTLPLTIVCVTTFTIFLVLTSGSSVTDLRQDQSHANKKTCMILQLSETNIGGCTVIKYWCLYEYKNSTRSQNTHQL